MSFRKKYNWFYKWKVCAHNNPIMTLLLHEKVGLSSAEIFHKNFLIVASCTFSKFKIRILTRNKFKNQTNDSFKLFGLNCNYSINNSFLNCWSPSLQILSGKKDIPLRPMLPMAGSPYHKIAQKVTEWLSVVPESKINSSTQKTVESLKRTTLEPDKVIISFDVTSLYTNVPVKEAIHETPDRLYSGDLQAPSPSWHPNLKFILEVE